MDSMRQEYLDALCNPKGVQSGLAFGKRHQWQIHTTAERWERATINTETLEIVRENFTPKEMVVTKVYCIHCLEVRDI